MLSIQITMPVLLITPGLHLIISTWVITHIPGMVLVTDMAAGFLSGSAMVIHRGITLIVTMVIIHHGMPRIITTRIIRPGDPITVTTHTITVVTTSTTRATVEVGAIATREMIIMIPVTVVLKMRTGMKILMSAVTREANLTAIARHGLTVMYQLRHPGIQATGVW